MRLLLLSLLLAPLHLTYGQAVFTYENENGSLSFSDTPPTDAPYEIKTLPTLGRITNPQLSTRQKQVFFETNPQKVAELRKIISNVASTHNLEPELVEAIVKAESAYNENAVSKKGARGLMQLMPQTASALGVTDVHDPKENIQGGSKLISELLSRYNGNLDLALAAYNAGDEAVKKYKGIPPYQETIDYVSKVRKYYDHFASRQNTELLAR